MKRREFIFSTAQWQCGRRLPPVSPAHPGNPRRNIEGESPHLWKGHTVWGSTVVPVSLWGTLPL
jgi:hypothetical protein